MVTTRGWRAEVLLKWAIGFPGPPPPTPLVYMENQYFGPTVRTNSGIIYIQTSVFLHPLCVSGDLTPASRMSLRCRSRPSALGPPRSSLRARPFPVIPAPPLAPRPTISRWWSFTRNLHAFIEFKVVFCFCLSICHIATCTFELLISIVQGRTGDRYYEWMNRGTLTAPLPAYEECFQWGCEWCHSSGHGHHYDIYFLTVFLSSDWNVPLLCRLSVHSCLEKRSERSGKDEWVMDEWEGWTPGSWDHDYCTDVCVDVLIKHWWFYLFFVCFKQCTFVL